MLGACSEKLEALHARNSGSPICDHVRNADQFHIILLRDRCCHAFSDHAIAVYGDTNFVSAIHGTRSLPLARWNTENNARQSYVAGGLKIQLALSHGNPLACGSGLPCNPPHYARGRLSVGGFEPQVSHIPHYDVRSGLLEGG